jgi:hypothetical protein
LTFGIKNSKLINIKKQKNVIFKNVMAKLNITKPKAVLGLALPSMP